MEASTGVVSGVRRGGVPPVVWVPVLLSSLESIPRGAVLSARSGAI